MLGSIFGACAHQQDIASVPADEFEEAITANRVQLVDARTAGEYAEGHIGNAVNIDVQQSDFLEQAKASLNKKERVYVYCRSGKRSMMAAGILKKDGFDVVNLIGGIMDWESQGKPIQK